MPKTVLPGKTLRLAPCRGGGFVSHAGEAAGEFSGLVSPGVALNPLRVGERMRPRAQSLQKAEEAEEDLFFLREIQNSCAAHFVQQRGCVSSVSCQRKNGLAQTEIFIRLGRDLVVAIRSLKQQEAIRFRAFLQGLAIRYVRPELNQIGDSEVLNHLLIRIFGTRRAERDGKRGGAQFASMLEPRQCAEERPRIALLGIDEAGVQQAHRPIGREGSRWSRG